MFELATPLALIALPIPFLIWWLLPRAKKTCQSSLKIPFFDAVTNIESTAEYRTGYHFWWFYLIWLLIILAASGPRWVGSPLPLKHEGHNIMLILDISGSMEIRDRIHNGRPTTRLEIVKKTAEKFVKNRHDAQMGLILFGTRAYLQTPLTTDRASILMRLDDATVGLAGKTTSIGDALGLAIKHMQHTPKKGRVIVLLTDGANNSGALLPLKAAALAKDNEIKVYTIGLSSQTGTPVFRGIPTVGDDLDEGTLKTIASMTHAEYFHATDKRSLEKTYQRINQLETVTHESSTARPEKAFYPYPLAFALLCLMLWLLRAAFRGQHR